MKLHRVWCAFVGACAMFLVACGGGDKGTSGDFRLLQFVESGKNGIPRNRSLVFRFSSPVAADQDFPERLKIQNVTSDSTGSDFSKAIGVYVVEAEKVTFVPRLPQRDDRSDSGLRANGEYHVFVKAGADSLESTSGARIASQQEFLFDTSENFEDIIPDQPPRASRLVALDLTNDSETEVSRLDVVPADLRQRDSAELLAAGAVIDPGAGGPPTYAIPWAFELHVSEPLDPLSISTGTVQMFQIRENALQAGNTAADGWMGTEVFFRVPLKVQAIQTCDECGVLDIHVRATPLQTLVDNARYRIVFKGEIMGLDYRKDFIGENGLTGNGLVHSAMQQPDPPAYEVGGQGYTAEFLVWDRAAISSYRKLQYSSVLDGIKPEKGQTAVDERKWNSSLYDPAGNPGFAVGFLNAFGDGRDENFAVSGGQVKVLDTGSERNDFAGNPFPVKDMDPQNKYPNTGSVNRANAPTIHYDSPLYTEWQFESMTIASASTLQLTGINPARLRVRGIVQVAGVLNAAGSDGVAGGNPGAGGPGGYSGGDSSIGIAQYSSLSYGTCMPSYDTWMSGLSGAQNYPWSHHGEGPGRGYAGGDVGIWYYYYDMDFGSTGGGGGGHGAEGQNGEDRLNEAAGVTEGVGKACTQYGAPYSLYLPLRGGGGFTYGDPTMKKDWVGGGGGGAGGTVNMIYNYYNGQPAGGGGGGGGGAVEIICAGPFIAAGGFVNLRGGNGGKGQYMPTSLSYGYADAFSGGGGGGAGGAISIISGDSVNLAGALIDTRGGAGGLRPNVGTTNTACKSCNAGGNGGKGIIFLMDANGTIDGIFPSVPGTYPAYQYGLLTISTFDGTRFQASSAITELFAMPAADPAYEPLRAGDVVGVVSTGQSIDLYASSARASSGDPLRPDLASEPDFDAMIPVARIVAVGSGSAVEILPLPPGNGDNMKLLNPTGTPNRDAFARIRADFHYSNQVEAALGPFAMMDEVTIRFTFNG